MDISQIAKIAAQQANLHFINNSVTAPTNDEWNLAFAQFILAAIPKEPMVDALMLELRRLSGMYQRATGYEEPSSVTRVLAGARVNGESDEA